MSGVVGAPAPVGGGRNMRHAHIRGHATAAQRWWLASNHRAADLLRQAVADSEPHLPGRWPTRTLPMDRAARIRRELDRAELVRLGLAVLGDPAGPAGLYPTDAGRECLAWLTEPGTVRGGTR